MANVNPVGWFDLYVADLNRAKKFYETVFSITLADANIEWGRQSFFPFNPEGINITGALVEKPDFKPDGNNTLIYFEVDDMITIEQRIENAGGKVIQPKLSIGDFGFISIFIDTEGNTVGLHSRK